MRQIALDHNTSIISLLGSIRATNKSGDAIDFYVGVEEVCKIVKSATDDGNKIMFVGNGGSAAIASHLSTDFWKNGGMRATAFNDSSLLTCISNDYGYQSVFEKPIEMFADKGDVLVAISSSGKSENITRAVEAARKKECGVVTLSGFEKNNPLRSMGDFNFYVPSSEYGYVEVIHHYICHCILDTKMTHFG